MDGWKTSFFGGVLFVGRYYGYGNSDEFLTWQCPRIQLLVKLHEVIIKSFWETYGREKKKNIKTSASVKPSGCQILEDFVALLSLLFCTYAPNYCPSFREHDENRPRWKSWSRGSAECNAMPRISHSFHFEKSMAADSLLWYMWGSPDFLASSNDPWNFSWLKISRRSHGQIPKGKDKWATSAMSRSEPYSWNQYGLI